MGLNSHTGDRCFLNLVQIQLQRLLGTAGQRDLSRSVLGSECGCRTSLVVQQLRLCSQCKGGPRFDPWSGNQIPHASTKDPQCRTKKISCDTVKTSCRGFPGGPVVKNPPANAGDTGSMPGSGKIPHASEQRSPCATTPEQGLQGSRMAITGPTCPRAGALQQEKLLLRNEEWPPLFEVTACTAVKTQHSHK